MNFLLTGVPGSSKTLNAIKMILEDPQFQNRPVYYYNLNGCEVPNWIALSEQDAKEWYKLPPGSVVLFDEAQEIFRPLSRDKAKPETYTRLEKSRHDGYDLILTTQHPMFLDTHVRRLCHEHRHYERPFATKKPRMLRWQGVKDDPTDYHARQDAEVTRVKLDQKYFGLYTSTQFNTHKPRFSKKLMMVAASILFVLAFGAHFAWKKINQHSELADVAAAASESGPAGVVPALQSAPVASEFKPRYPMDPVEYLRIFTPRVAGMPASAPAYDHLMEPTVAPKTRCFAWYREGVRNCKCVTQQMTPIATPLAQCLNTVDNGMWDPTIKPANYDANGRMLGAAM